MADGITRIAVEGFKSIARRQEIEIAPLTILAGANSSGKSSIMQPLLMLKQTLDARYDPGPLKIDGDNVRFSSNDQFLSKNGDAARKAILTVEITSDDRRYTVRFRKKGALEFELEQTSTVRGKLLTLRPDMSETEIRSQFDLAESGNNLTVLRAGFLLNVGLISGTPVTSQWIEPFLRRLLHVPSLRGTKSRVYNVAAPGPSFPGTFDDYVASVIHHWESHDHDKYDALNIDLRRVGLTQKVHAHKFNDASIELQVPRLMEGDPSDILNIADVGFGVSQVLTVLVSLRTADNGQLVYLEEPEIHLHPRAQAKLADILADAAKRGVRVVAETHSSLLLRAVQTLLAKGDLDPELVRLHWFTRDTEGVTQVSSAKPDANGAFGDWPEDFGDVALRSEQEYLDAVEGRITS
jgi:predicted ATPase